MAKKARVAERPLDTRDVQIVEALRRDAWQSYAELAKRIHLSASAVQRRVERLIAAGVLLGAYASVDDSKLGKEIRIIVLVELRDDATATLNAFARKLGAAREVVEALYVAGAYDVVLELRARSMSEYAAFAATALNENPHVKRYRTLTELKQLV